MDTALVPSQFPFAYFSDNAGSVYLYQIPVYTFHARPLNLLNGIDSTGYFGFNASDRKMEFHKVGGLSKANSDIEKLMTIMDGKRLLRSGFVNQGHVYLVTKDAVYILDQQSMQKDSMPNHTRVALGDFLQCSQNAIRKNHCLSICFPLIKLYLQTVRTIDWVQVTAYIIAAILLVIIIILCYSIVQTSGKPSSTLPSATGQSKSRKSGSKRSKSPIGSGSKAV